MSGLSEAELHVQAMRLVCEALQDREQDGLEVDWDVIRQMHDQMDAILQALQHRHRYDSSEIVDLRKDRDHWKQARQDAHEAGELMRAEIERLQAFVNLSRRLLTGSINYVEVDRLRAGLAELDAGTEPTPVAEPLDVESNTCPGT